MRDGLSMEDASSMGASAQPIVLACSDPRGQGRPMLLVHGFSHDRSVWSKLASELAPGLRPIAVDLRGHGRSDWSPAGCYDLHDYACDLPATLDALGLERAIVVAHSLGGHAATLFAAAHPERLEALVLVDTGPTLALEGMLQIARDVGAGLRSFESIAARARRLAQTHPLADPELIACMAESGVVRRLDGRFEPRLDPGTLPGGPDDGSPLAEREAVLWHALARVRCPTLVVRGGLSAILPESVARRMVDEVLADGRLETLPRAGHGVMLDDGPGLLRCLESFLAELAVRVAPAGLPVRELESGSVRSTSGSGVRSGSSPRP
jgi:pimeloyl-ACP methyl ester carboxylesterase